jgi:hypothetical protein
LGLAQEAFGNTFQRILIPSNVNKLVLGVDKLNEHGIATYEIYEFKVTRNQ